MKNKKGFTLIELIVCIGIIVGLNVVIGYNIKLASRTSKSNKYKATMNEVFKAASDYVELSTSTCQMAYGDYCAVTIDDLVKSGLLDVTIYDTKIPAYADGSKFEKNTLINVNKAYGKKVVSFDCVNSEYSITSENLDNYAKNYLWERCE